ncbi:hypothetical protein KR084_004813 [Drosophila pseudotakahashii]|nr:hypothetical protein KR084_004813 [Drosophila pseudotakahashii]
MLENAVTVDRPIYQDIQRLTDAQLSVMCQSHRIFPGPITFRNRRLVERQLHIAMIEERAKQRAYQQFARECNRQTPGNFQQVPPPQQHYGLMQALPQNPNQNVIPRTYWPSPGSSNVRSPPRSFLNRANRPDPILEPSRYITWRQQNRLMDKSKSNRGTNILGFNMPFSLEAAMDFSSRISSTIRRFRGGGEEEEEAVISARSEQEGKYNDDDHSLEDSDEETSKSYQESYLERDTLSESSEDENQQKKVKKEKDARSQDAYVYPFPYDFRELRRLVDAADAESQNELCDYKSFISLSSVYHEFASQVPMARTAPSVDSKPRFRWWWQRRAEAGDERIPEAEQTTEQDLLQECELKTINYLSEAPARVDDGMLELMGRVELRDDSDGEEVTVENNRGGRRLRSYGGFFRHIFHLLCCDRQGKLDAEKLRCSFFCCCMAVGVYVGFKMLR